MSSLRSGAVAASQRNVPALARPRDERIRVGMRRVQETLPCMARWMGAAESARRCGDMEERLSVRETSFGSASRTFRTRVLRARRSLSN